HVRNPSRGAASAWIEPRPPSRASCGQRALRSAIARRNAGAISGAISVRAFVIRAIVSLMRLTDDRIAGAFLVRSYAPGEVRVGDAVLHRSCLISAERLID